MTIDEENSFIGGFEEKRCLWVYQDLPPHQGSRECHRTSPPHLFPTSANSYNYKRGDRGEGKGLRRGGPDEGQTNKGLNEIYMYHRKILNCASCLKMSERAVLQGYHLIAVFIIRKIERRIEIIYIYIVYLYRNIKDRYTQSEKEKEEMQIYVHIRKGDVIDNYKTTPGE